MTCRIALAASRIEMTDRPCQGISRARIAGVGSLAAAREILSPAASCQPRSRAGLARNLPAAKHCNHRSREGGLHV